MSTQPEALRLADACEESANEWRNEIDTRVDAAAELRRLHAENEALRRDAERLDWLECWINNEGAIHLHDGDHPYGSGLGLRPGSMVRTLRTAIDSALQQKEAG